MKPNDVLRYGVIISDREERIWSDYYRQYTILCDGRYWFLGKKNGEWVSVRSCKFSGTRL